MGGAVVISYIGLSIISYLAGTPAPGEMGDNTIFLWLLAFFLISFALAIVSVLAGIGGSVIFTPVMMVFTPIDSVVIRATGLIFAMFGGIISTGIFMKKGIGHYKMCATLCVSQGIGALFGAQCAIYLANMFGAAGDGVTRMLLGVLLIGVALFLFFGGKNMDWPDIKNVDVITKWLKLDHTYFEESDGKTYTFKITRILPGMGCVLLIGFIGGFFGMGAGWAITPVQNLVLGVPLKVAAANSSIILGMVDCVAVWPYMLAGAIIPLFVLPWLSGQVVGGYVGALVMVKAKVTVIRIILIGIMVFTSFGLITDGLAKLGAMQKVPGSVSIIFFCIVMAVDIVIILFTQNTAKAGGSAHEKQ